MRFSESDIDADLEAMAVPALYERALGSGARDDIFEHVLDARVIEAIDDLPDEYRAVLVLSDLGDLNYGEIARVLDVPAGTVKSRLFRARRKLQERLIDLAADVGPGGMPGYENRNDSLRRGREASLGFPRR